MTEKPTGAPQFLPVEKAKEFAGQPIGTKRLLTIFEDGDLGLSGLSREEAASMTPAELAELADANSGELLGS